MPIYSINNGSPKKRLRNDKRNNRRFYRSSQQISTKEEEREIRDNGEKIYSRHALSTRAGMSLLSVLLLITVLGSIGLYVVAINASAVRGAQVRDLEDTIAQLESAQGELEIKAASLRAKSHLNIGEAEVLLERVNLVQYISITGEDTVASR